MATQTLYVSEIISKLGSLPTREAKKKMLLTLVNDRAFLSVIYNLMYPVIEFAITEIPPYKQCNMPIDLAPVRLTVETCRIFATLTKDAPGTLAQKKARVISYLEGMSGEEARVFNGVLLKNLEIPGVDITLIRECFPRLIPTVVYVNQQSNKVVSNVPVAVPAAPVAQVAPTTLLTEVAKEASRIPLEETRVAPPVVLDKENRIYASQEVPDFNGPLISPSFMVPNKPIVTTRVEIPIVTKEVIEEAPKVPSRKLNKYEKTRKGNLTKKLKKAQKELEQFSKEIEEIDSGKWYTELAAKETKKEEVKQS